MTVTSTLTRKEFIGTGVATEFDLSPMRVFSAAELRVTVNGAVLPSFTFVADGNGSGEVLITPAPANLATIVIEANPAFTQQIDFENEGPYLPETQNEGLDRSVARDLLLKAGVDRSVRVASGSAPINPVTPEPGKFLTWGPGGQVVNSSGTGGADGALRADLAGAGGAALVGYGARSVADILESMSVNVLQYAAGDDETDDTAAFQAAATAAYVNGKSLVLVPPAIGYRINGTVIVPPGVTFYGYSMSREWWASAFNETYQHRIRKPASGSTDGPIFEMSTRSVLRGLNIIYARLSGAETGVIRMGPNTNSGQCFNARVIDCQIEGRAFDGGSLYYNAQCHAIWSPESTFTPTRQRYFNDVVNCYLVNFDQGVTLNGQSNGWNIINLRTFQVYRPIVLDGGSSEVADTMIHGLHAQNFGPLPTADTYVLTMRGSVNVLSVSGLSECQGRAYDVSGLTSYSQWNLNGFIPNESLPSYLPPNAEQQGFSTGTMREGLSRTFIVDPARDLDRHVQLRGMKYDGPLPVTGSLPTLAGGTAPQALVQANASSRIIAAFQTGPYSVGSHPLLRVTLKVIVDGPATSGASYAEVEFLYRRTTSTGAGAGSLTVLRTPINEGPGIAGLFFIHSKTAGGFMKIGMVGGGAGGPAPDYIQIELKCSAYAADGSTWARDGFTNISTVAVAATANDVTDAVSLLATGTTAI